jgi:hypothetical protein
MLRECISLNKLDFKLPMNPITLGDNVFRQMTNFSGNIETLFPTAGFSTNKLSAKNLFAGCEKLKGTVPADLLWNNKSVEWSNTENCFGSCGNALEYTCSAEIRAQVPVSWGGTNKLIDEQLKLKAANVDTSDYTAFEVMPHKDEIPVGYCEELGANIATAVGANTTQMFTLRTMQLDHTKSDIVVDWGDGYVSVIAAGEFSSDSTIADTSADASAGERNYTVLHDYADNMTADREKFVVKIYGSQYYNIQSKSVPSEKPAGVTYLYSNLMCRVFSEDLPIALHVGNLTGFCEKALLLTSVDANAIKYRYFEQASQCFRYCENLISATGFKRAFTKSYCAQMFAACHNLVSSDAQLALDSLRTNAGSGMYTDCINLTTTISSLIPEVFGSYGPYGVQNAFNNCRSLTGTVPANKLWNNPFVTWSNTASCFAKCSDEIRAQVPVSWGGTASNDIIEQSSSKQDAEQNARIAAIETHLGMN